MSTQPGAPNGMPSAASPSVAAPPGSVAGQGGDSLGDLIRDLTQQGSLLAEQQLALVKAEVREAVTDVKTAVGSMAGAAVVGIAALGVVLIGLGHLLGDLLDNPGLGILLVGLGALVVAWLMYAAGRKKMDAAHLSPERSRRTLERVPDVARGNLTEHKQ